MFFQVALVMGSHSDYGKMEPALNLFKEFGVDCEARILSAHRTPDETAEYARSAESRGIKVIVAAAGGAAHLPGVIASHTILPVIGVPIALPALGGLDSLLSMTQMPAGVPVSVMSVGGGGPENAVLTAISILALGNPGLAEKLRDYRRRLADKVRDRDSSLQWKQPIN
ncbi:MAG: 5-(carboxyamino)imidazole ribonucleotide mutase [Planctomycetota bacterium]|jgi:5-(carboxyamino)imidazole ribonucleotide mutase|nr:5-(carboxyamino)imidazole ribonucleotide mutase [Planctomycetota bacterium]